MMFKKVSLFLFFLTIFLISGCSTKNKIEEASEDTAISKENLFVNTTAWIYTPSTRTIPNTMTAYDLPTEFTIDNITITTQLPMAKNLKNDYNEKLNTWIETSATELAKKTVNHVDFSTLKQNAGISEYLVTNHIYITGNLSFIGCYASLHLTATPGLIHKNTKDIIDIAPFLNEIDSFSMFYDINKNQEISTQKLFLNDKEYITVLEKELQKQLFLQETEPFNTVKQSFSDLSENDFMLSYYDGIAENRSPYFLVKLEKENPYYIGQTDFKIDLALLLPYLSFSPNEMTEIMEIPNLLTKQLIDTTSTFDVKQDTAITVENCNNSFFIGIENYKNKDMTDHVNEQLSAAQRTYINITPLSDYFSDSNTPSLKVLSYKGLGPFLKVFMRSDVNIDNTYLFHQQNMLIYMPTAEQMTVRDLLLPESLDKLTEQQLNYLDSTDFTLDSTGKITVPLGTVAEDGSMNLVYESKLFDFSKYNTF